MNLSEQLHAGPHSYIHKGVETKWRAKSCSKSAVFPTQDAALVQILRAGKTYLVTPPKLHAQWLYVYNVRPEQCIFPANSTTVRKAELPEGQGYVSGQQSLDCLRSVTVEMVDEEKLAAVKGAQAAEADERVASLFYTEISRSDDSASQKDSIVDNPSSEDVVDASAKSNSAFLCMDQAAQNAPDFWLKEDLPEI